MNTDVNMIINNFGMATVSKLAVVVAILMVLFISNVNAFWRLECDGSVGLARMDPLINPGTSGDHVHSIKGGSGKYPVSSGFSVIRKILLILYLVFLSFSTLSIPSLEQELIRFNDQPLVPPLPQKTC